MCHPHLQQHTQHIAGAARAMGPRYSASISTRVATCDSRGATPEVCSKNANQLDVHAAPTSRAVVLTKLPATLLLLHCALRWASPPLSHTHTSPVSILPHSAITDAQETIRFQCCSSALQVPCLRARCNLLTLTSFPAHPRIQPRIISLSLSRLPHLRVSSLCMRHSTVFWPPLLAHASPTHGAPLQPSSTTNTPPFLSYPPNTQSSLVRPRRLLQPASYHLLPPNSVTCALPSSRYASPSHCFCLHHNSLILLHYPHVPHYFPSATQPSIHPTRQTSQPPPLCICVFACVSVCAPEK